MRHMGLGNAILLELPDERCAVIDWGTTERVDRDYLLEVLGNREMAFVAATHGHQDHTAGLPWLFKQLMDPEAGRSRIRSYLIPLADNPKRSCGLTRCRLLPTIYVFSQASNFNLQTTCDTAGAVSRISTSGVS